MTVENAIANKIAKIEKPGKHESMYSASVHRHSVPHDCISWQEAQMIHNSNAVGVMLIFTVSLRIFGEKHCQTSVARGLSERSLSTACSNQNSEANGVSALTSAHAAAN